MSAVITDQCPPRIPSQAIRDRLAQLPPDQLEVGLVFLARHDPRLFDRVLRAAQTWNDGDRLSTRPGST